MLTLSSLFCTFHRALWFNIPALFLVITICTLDGMVIFATYADCDLKEQGEITTGDQVENGAKSPRESVGPLLHFDVTH